MIEGKRPLSISLRAGIMKSNYKIWFISEKLKAQTFQSIVALQKV